MRYSLIAYTIARFDWQEKDEVGNPEFVFADGVQDHV